MRAGDPARDTIGGDIAGKARQIAEILEALGIALADDFGIRVLVEDPDQLPGVAVRGPACGSVIVILDQIADLVFIALELRVVRAAAVLADDLRRLVHGVTYRGALGGVDLIGVRRVFGGHRKTDFDDRSRTQPCACGLVIPVQLVGASCQQSADECIEVKTAGNAARIAENRGGPLARGDLRDHRAQLVIGLLRGAGQRRSDVLDVQQPFAAGAQRIQHHPGIAVQQALAAAAGAVSAHCPGAAGEF